MLRRSIFFIAIFALSLSAQVPQSRKPFTFEDMMMLKRISDPVLSPDGKWVLFSAIDVNLDENTRKSHLWLVPTAGGEAKPLTSGAAGESRGRFSPDGKRISFLTARDGGSQVWLQDFDGANGALSGEPRRLTNISTEADGAIWSPDGKHILFTSQVYPDCPKDDDACNAARDEARAKSKVKASLFTRLFYRHWSSFTNFKRSHLFAIGVDESAPTAPRDLTPGDHDVPPFSLGGQDFYAVSPDGQEVAYTSNLDAVEATSTNNEILLVPITGGAPKKISASPGSDSTPLYSPDGKYLAYRTQRRAGYESDRFLLALYDRKAGTTRILTEKADQWVNTIAWAPDSSAIYFNSDDKGDTPIYRVSINGGEVKEVLRGHSDEMQLSADGKSMVFTRMSIERPNEVFKVALEKGVAVGKPVALTDLNRAVFARAHTSPLESFWFTGAEKAKVQGFLVKPPGFDPAKKYPVKFIIHGGPQGAWGDAWTYRWNSQLFAAGGYVVVAINPRGSTGYGQSFIDDVNADWGGRAYEDLMLGLDHAQRAFPFLDKDRTCAMGASYGGYMVNWIITHNNRFQCAVSHDGTWNTESQWGTTEELFFKEWEFKGTPFTNREMYQKWSPHLYAGSNIKTPTLVVHGQLDYRVDVSEGFQMFTTLQRLNVPSKMLYFPDEGHWVLKPQNSRLWYQTVNGWVDEYLKGSKPPVAKPAKQ